MDTILWLMALVAMAYGSFCGWHVERVLKHHDETIKKWGETIDQWTETIKRCQKLEAEIATLKNSTPEVSK